MTTMGDPTHGHADADPSHPMNDGHEESGSSATPVVDALRARLEALGLRSTGTRADLSKRLAKAERKAKAAEEDARRAAELAAATALRDAKPQPYDVYFVCDVEATCESNSSFDFPSEIIEFPVIAISGETLETIGTFHRYVRPLLNPKLSEFCTRLTGIQQDQVDSADPFSVVFADFLVWAASFTNDLDNNAIFVTDGPWDLRDFVTKELTYAQINRPKWINKIVDMRKQFIRFTQKKPDSDNLGKDDVEANVDTDNQEAAVGDDDKAVAKVDLSGMLTALGMVFEGREHCGLDDTKNVVRIFRHLASAGCRMDWTSDVRKKAPRGAWKQLRKPGGSAKDTNNACASR